MDMQTKKPSNVKELITQAGGPSAIGRGVGISPQAVVKWRRNGIKDNHWTRLMAMLPGLSASDLVAINQSTRAQN